MVAISTSTVTVTASVPPPAQKPAASDIAAFPAANDPVDTVTLSAEARQVLDGQAPPPIAPAPAAADATPQAPSQDQIAAAVAALNDTSDKASLDDQLKAYALLSNLVAKGQVLPDNRALPAASPPGGMIKASDAQALLASPFSQHLNKLVAAVDAQQDPGASDNGYDLANVIDRSLASFDALSPDDQQTYVTAKSVYAGVVGQSAPPATVADYRANQQAQADVDRALQAAQDNPTYASQIQAGPNGRNNFASRTAAMAALAQKAGDTATAALAQLAATDPASDAFTKGAQAYFAKNGPPPSPHADTGQGFAQAPRTASPAGYTPPDAKALMAALAQVDDTSGAVMAKDQAAALKLLNGYAANAGAAGAAVALNVAASPYAQHTAQELRLVNNYLVPGKDPYPQILDHLNALSPEDQTTYFAASSTAADGTVLYASLDSLKDNLTTRETMLTLYNAVTKAYGVQDLAHLTTAAAKNNPALQQLEQIFRADQGNDGWTATAKGFLAHTTPADLGLVPLDDQGDPDMAKALQTLKDIRANQTAFITAVKAGHMQDWRPVAEAQKAKLKAQADDLMSQATGTTGATAGAS
jgi:hypothetical protein